MHEKISIKSGALAPFPIVKERGKHPIIYHGLFYILNTLSQGLKVDDQIGSHGLEFNGHDLHVSA